MTEDRIYKGQTLFKLYLNTYIDLTTTTSMSMKYKKPDGEEGTTTAVSDDKASGIMYHDFQDGLLDMAGEWTFWTYAEFPVGEIAGNPFKLMVYNQGEAA